MPYQTFRQIQNFSLKIAWNKIGKDLLLVFAFATVELPDWFWYSNN